MGIECETKFFDLDSTREPKSTLEPKVDIPELVLVPELFISKTKSSISQNHILLLDQGIDQNDSVMIFKIDHVKVIIFMIGSCMILFILEIVNMYIEKRSIKMGSMN